MVPDSKHLPLWRHGVVDYIIKQVMGLHTMYFSFQEQQLEYMT